MYSRKLYGCGVDMEALQVLIRATKYISQIITRPVNAVLEP